MRMKSAQFSLVYSLQLHTIINSVEKLKCDEHYGLYIW
jgi:hypothetical protein